MLTSLFLFFNKRQLQVGLRNEIQIKNTLDVNFLSDLTPLSFA